MTWLCISDHEEHETDDDTVRPTPPNPPSHRLPLVSSPVKAANVRLGRRGDDFEARHHAKPQADRPAATKALLGFGSETGHLGVRVLAAKAMRVSNFGTAALGTRPARRSEGYGRRDEEAQPGLGRPRGAAHE